MSVRDRSAGSMGSRRSDMPLRVVTAAALFIDAGVHVHLAPGYQAGNPAGIGQSNLFLLESAAAILSALYVLLKGSRSG